MGTQKQRIDILVIEDDPSIAEFVVDLLTFEGYQAVAFADGSALERIIADPPQLFLIDLMLPGLDGVEICKRLRAARATSALPIIMMTASGPVARAQRLRGCSYDALLLKPFDVEDMLSLVSRYLRRAAAGTFSNQISLETQA